MNYTDYFKFVDAVTSNESKNAYEFGQRSVELIEERNFAVHRYLTAALGLSAEAGEFTEVVKKIVFQGKPVNEDNIFHMKRELGDIMWYLAQACMALDTSLEEIVQMNIDKLSSRYPDGYFDSYFSENRQEGDV